MLPGPSLSERNGKTKMDKTEKIIRQFQDKEEIERAGEKSFVTLRLLKGAFYLKTKDGPEEVVSAGSLVSLHDRMLIELLFFTGRAEPVDPAVPDVAEYIVRRKFQTVVDGLYVEVLENDIVQLSRPEALDFMRRHLIKPLAEDVFYLP